MAVQYSSTPTISLSKTWREYIPPKKEKKEYVIKEDWEFSLILFCWCFGLLNNESKILAIFDQSLISQCNIWCNVKEKNYLVVPAVKDASQTPPGRYI
jgi:hypothetical protein